MALAFAAQAVPLAADRDGVVRVAGTRVTLDTVVGAFNDGATAEQIALRYDALALPDVYASIAYYLKNKSEVDAYLAQRGQRAALARREMASLYDMSAVRERLLARQAQSS